MRMLDLFSGIGGFHKGFEQAGYTFDWVGFSEIDKYASAVYKHKFPKAEELGDIKLIQPGRDLPDHIDIVCGGFPCQAFSVAGLRLGWKDSRGTLFFEIARILRHYRDIGNPISCLVLENVKGLLSHDNGRTFTVIYRILSDLGYTIEFELLNTRWWLPQNRERIYIVGYIGNRGGPQVFPIGENGEAIGSECGSRDAVSCIDASYYKGADGKRTMIKQIGKLNNGDAGRVFDPDGIACTLKALGGGMGAKTGLYKVPEATKKGYAEAEINNPLKDNTSKGWHFEQNVYDSKSILRSLKSTQGSGNKPKVIIPEATKKGYAEAEVGDSINLSVPNSETRRGRVGKGEAQTLDTGMQQYTIQEMTEVRTDEAKELRRKYGKDPRRLKKLKERCDGVTSALTTGQSKESMVKINTNIRRLTPRECNRLQGFSDDHNKYGVMDGKVVEMSDTQRYKQAGNAVTVDVVQAVAERIRPLFEDNERV